MIDGVPRHCIGCGYSLEGIKGGTCPECGRGFDLNDSDTWCGSPGAAVGRRLLAPSISLSELAVATIAALLVLYSYTPPNRYERYNVIGVALFVLVTLLWLARVADKLMFPPRRKRVVRLGGLVVIPAIVVTCIMLVSHDVPLRLGCRWSRDGFRALASQVAARPPGSRPSGRAGLYYLEESGIWANGIIIFRVRGDSEVYGRFFMYVPDKWLRGLQQRQADDEEMIERSKNWYTWRRYGSSGRPLRI